MANAVHQILSVSLSQCRGLMSNFLSLMALAFPTEDEQQPSNFGEGRQALCAKETTCGLYQQTVRSRLSPKSYEYLHRRTLVPCESASGLVLHPLLFTTLHLTFALLQIPSIFYLQLVIIVSLILSCLVSHVVVL